MDAAYYQLTQEGRLSELGGAEAQRRWRNGEGFFWIRLRDPTEPEAELLLEEIGVEDVLKDKMLRAGQETSFVALQHAVFVEWPVFADDACTRRSQVSALCLPNLIITMRSDPIDAPTETVESLDLSELGPASTSTLLCWMLMWHGTRTAHAARALRARMLEIDERMDADPGDVGNVELCELKSDLLLASGIIEEQDEAFRLLAQTDNEALSFSRVQGAMSLICSSASAARRLDERLDSRFFELRHRASEYKQDMLNVRISVLTVISTIFLPLTLLAGIWGMNFEVMPELELPWAYPAALGLMVLIAALVSWSLFKRGWFD